MYLRRTIAIHAGAQATWPFVADPVLMSDWNPKIVAVDRDRDGPVQTGERFMMTYQMSGRDRETAVEITQAQPLRQVTYLHTFAAGQALRRFTESYRIEQEVGGGVTLTQSIDMAGSGILPPLQWVIWLIHRFGRETDEPCLQRLRQRAEELGQPESELPDENHRVSKSPG